MAIVGDAVVRVTALKNSFRDSLRSEFSGAQSDADKAGADTGKRFSEAAKGESGKFIEGLDMSPLSKKADTAGADVGRRFSNAAKNETSSFIEGLDMSPIAKKADAAGTDSGRRWTSKFESALRGLNDSIVGRFGTQAAGDAGDSSGRSFTDRMSSKLKDLDVATADVFRRLADRAGNSGGTGGGLFRNFFKRAALGVEDDIAAIGDDGAKSIGSKFSAIKFDMPNFPDLLPKIIALVPLVGVLGGGLAALVGAATSMAAAFTYAAGASAILATGLVGLAAGVITGILALGGIGAALKAMSNQQANAGKEALAAAKAQKAAANQIQSAQDAVVSANQRVSRAERDLARTRKDVARQVITDERAVKDAEQRLADAQRTARLAQIALTQAREDAKKKLRDLQMQERGAVIGEEEATLRLREARAAYTKSLNDPNASADDKEQARIDLENAELALDQAKANRQDVTKETDKANKAGIEGSDLVVAAKQKITDANDNVKKAEQAVSDARDKQAQDAVDGAQRIADAQQNVADAIKASARASQQLADAQANAKTATDGFAASTLRLNKAMANLSPDGQKFAKYLYSLRPVLNDLRAAAGEDLFGPLTLAVKSMVTSFLPTFKLALDNTGAGLGQFALRIAHAFDVKAFKDNFGTIAAGLSQINPKNNESAWTMFGNILTNVLRGITGIARAAMPTFLRFTGYLERMTRSFAGKFEGGNNIKRMTALIGDMGKQAAVIGHIFGATFGAIGNIFKAALPSGEKLNGSLLKTVQTFEKWTGSGPGQKRMHDFFENTRVLAGKIGTAVVELVKQFLKLGEDKGGKGGGIGKTFDTITKNLPHLEKAIADFTDKTAPKLVDVISDIVKAFENFSKSKTAGYIVTILKGVSTIIKGLSVGFKLPIIGTILSLGAALLAAFVIGNKLMKLFGVKAVGQAFQVLKAPGGTPRAAKAPTPLKFARGLLGGAERDETDIRDKDGNVIGRRKAPRATRAGDAIGRASARVDQAAGRAVRKAVSPVRGAITQFRNKGFPAFDPEHDDPLEYEADRQDHLAAQRAAKAARGPGRFKRAASSAMGRVRRGGGDDSGFLDVSEFQHLPKFHADVSDTVSKAVSREEKAGAPRTKTKEILKKHSANIKAGAKGSAKAVAGAAVLETGLDLASGNLDPTNFVEVGHKLGESLSGAFQTEIQDKIVEHGFEGFSKFREHLAKKGEEAGEKAGTSLVGKLGSKLSGIAGIAKKGGSALVGLGKTAASAAAGYVKLGAQAIIANGRVLLAAGAQKIVAGATKAWAAVQWLLNAAMDANPIGIAIVALAALVVGIIYAYKHSEKFRAIVKAALEGAQKAFQTLWKVVEPIIGFIKHHLELLLIPFGPLGIAIAGIILVFKNWSKIVDIVGGIFTTIVGFFTGLPDRIGGAVGGILSAVGREGKRIGTAIWNGITGAFGSIVDFIATPINVILDALRGMLKGLGKLKINIFGHKFGFPDWSGAIPDDINVSAPAATTGTTGGTNQTNKNQGHGLATGGTVLPRPGGTLLRIAEAGRPESVVDTGLINAQLRSSLNDSRNSRAELQRMIALLEVIAKQAGFNIENLHLNAAPSENVPAAAVPRVMRDLAYTMGT